MARGEFGEDHLEPAAGLGIEAEFVVPRVLNERMSATDHLGATQPLQPRIGRVRASNRP